MRKSPCELQIDLLCRGIELDPSCELARDARGFSRTRAGLGSGLELVLAGAPPLAKEIWVNAPVHEHFVKDTPYLLRLRETGAYEIADRRRSSELYGVRLPAEPAWYGSLAPSGQEMSSIGVLQGTYLAIYVGATCTFWTQELQCRFCTTGLNPDTQVAKQVDDVVATARAAKAESGVTFVHLNTGYQGGAAARLVAPHVAAIKEKVGALVGVQITPEVSLEEFDRLIDLGADHFSFCFEYFDPETFRRLCPGKDRELGQERFFRALEHCQRRLPTGACSGEIIAGNEPLESTLAAIDYITDLGAFPTVCIFRPLIGSGMQDDPSPGYEDMLAVMQHVWARCRDRGVPIGLAPNIEVSLVVQPTDAAYLARGTLRDRWYQAKLKLLRRMGRPTFRRRMQPR
ncbi:MAG: radical SAM protein [Planctomycetota bacterium]